MALTWANSGSGECSLTLQDAQHLALDAGFTFKGSTEGMPLARRADLQAMFEHFGVNSLTAFRRKFWSYEIRPGSGSSSGSSGGSGGTASPGTLLSLPAAAGTSDHPGPPGSSRAASRSRWGVQQQGRETYVGELLDGRRHGQGVLLCQGERSLLLHVGRFSEGKRNGPGIVVSSRGERFEGYFMDDVMWGPGQYTYASTSTATPAGAPDAASARDTASGAGPAPPQETPASGEAGSEAGGTSGSQGPASAASDGAAPHQQQQQPQQQPQQPHRVSFHGMMNGRPQGRGCLTRSDGSRQTGQFDGNNCYMRLKQEEVAGVLMVAGENAAEARAVAAEVQQVAGRQQAHVAEQAAQLFASMAQPSQL